MPARAYGFKSRPAHHRTYKEGFSNMVLGLSNDIKVKITEEKDCLRTLSVEMPPSAVQEKIEKAFEQVATRVKIPGFRPGKAPVAMVRENYKEAAYDQAQDLLLREGVSEAIKSKKIQAVATPVVTSVADFNPEKAFQFQFQVEVAPEFKVANYKGIKITKTVKPVSDADVEKAVKNLADLNARLIESKDETLGKTHFAVINYQGYLDGKPLEGGQAENFLMDMSAPQAIAGLAEGLLGAKAGDERDVPVTFPADSPSQELAGKQATFKVKLVAIKEKSVPAVDDEFAKDLGLPSLSELKSRVKENLVREREQAGKAEIERQIGDRLLEGNTFAVPASMVQRQAEYLVNRQKERMGQQGLSKEDIDKLVERMKPDAQKQAEREVRLAYVLDAVAEAEKIEASEDEITAKIASIVEKSDEAERAGLE
ncbi:MAG: trigger factor, partial [Elusimicrobia bacterium]|nr:trigger factor [Elusimicrobiota bacterium]